MSEPLMNDQHNKACWSIATLDFALALSSPQLPSFRYQCEAETLRLPKALANHQYAYLHHSDGENRLLRYDDLSKATSVMFSSEREYLHHFDYDANTKLFALMVRDEYFNNQLLFINDQGKVQRRSQIKLLPEMSHYQSFSANFSASGQYMLAANEGQLYKIDFDGFLQKFDIPETNLVSIDQHPMKNKMLAISGNKDIDVVLLNGEQLSEAEVTDLNSQALPYPSFSRTHGQERKAQFQPNGAYIAFVSDRAGKDQIWLKHQEDKSQAKQLTSLSSNRSIDNFRWSPKGDLIAWVLNDALALTDLIGNTRRVVLEKPLYSLLDWFEDGSLLVRIDNPVPGGLYQLDLASNKLVELNIQNVESAWVVNNRVFYANSLGKVFSRGLDDKATERRPHPMLNGKALVVKDSHIFSVDKHSNVLAKFDHQGNWIADVTNLKPTAWKLTDESNGRLLLEQFVAINNEVIVLEQR